MTEITKQRILIVDDTEASRYAVARVLTQAGFELMQAATGTEALHLATQDPDLILLDVSLPDLSGFEVCKRLKADPATASIPVLHLSASHVASRDLVHGMDGGADGYLRQPVEAPVLVATIRAFLRLGATEGALRESEDRYRDLVENSQDLICTHDLEGQLLSVNAAVVRLTGYSQETLLRMNLIDLLTRRARDSFALYLAQLRTQGAASGLMRIRTAAGEARCWEFRNTLRRDGVAAPVVRGMAQDVTERERVGDALRESEERFRSLTALSSDFYWETDSEHRLTLRSEGSKVPSKSVFSTGPRLGERRWEVPSLSPDAAGWQAHQAVLDAHQPFRDFCFSRRGIDAAERHISISGKPLFDGAGVFKGYHGVGTDITAQVKSDMALAETEARFRATFEQAAVGMAHVAPDGRWLRVNQKLSDIAGYTREELLGQSFQDITYPDDLDDDLEHVRQLLAAEISTYAIDKRYLRKDQGIVWVHLTVSLVRQVSGEPDYFISVIEDITERKRAGQQLVHSEERFRGLVEQSLIGIYLSDGASVHYINPRAEEILGYETGGLTGATLTPRITDRDRPRVVQEIRRLAQGQISVARLEFEMWRKDGSEVTIGAQIMRTHVDGRPAVICVMQDISEKKRTEEELQRHVAQLEVAFMSTVELATTLGEMRDPYRAGHERRVGDLAAAIGVELGFDAQRIEGLRVAGYLHDIGTFAAPAEILSKPAKLNRLELLLIQGHAQAGYEVLKKVKFPWPVAEIALQHHERMDGSGYPQGLKGEAILFDARIIALADVIEAMASHRPYRAALGIEAALTEIERGRGSVYDPQVVDACLRLFRDKAYQLAL